MSTTQRCSCLIQVSACQVKTIRFSFFQVNLIVQEESNLYEDILLQDFMESYNNLTVKSLLMVKFVQQGFVHSNFVFKAGLQI